MDSSSVELQTKTKTQKTENVEHMLQNSAVRNNNGDEFNKKEQSLDEVDCFEDSPLFKLREIANKLRPFVLQASASPDFDIGKASREIIEKTKEMAYHCRQENVPLDEEPRL